MAGWLAGSVCMKPARVICWRRMESPVFTSKIVLYVNEQESFGQNEITEGVD